MNMGALIQIVLPYFRSAKKMAEGFKDSVVLTIDGVGVSRPYCLLYYPILTLVFTSIAPLARLLPVPSNMFDNIS